MYSAIVAAMVLAAAGLMAGIVAKAIAVCIGQARAYRMLSAYSGPQPVFPWGNAPERGKHAGRTCDMHLKYIEEFCSSEKPCYALLGPMFFRALAGTTNEIVTADPRVVKHCLHDRFDVWTKSNPGGRILNTLEAFLGAGIFTTDHGEMAEYPACDKGHLWKAQRRVAAAIFTRDLFKTHYQKVFLDYAGALVVRLREEVGPGGVKPVDFQKHMNAFTLDCFGRIALGTDLGSSGGAGAAFSDAFDRGSAGVLDFIRRHLKPMLLRELLPEPVGGFVQRHFIERSSSTFQDLERCSETIRTHIRSLLHARRKAVAEAEASGPPADTDAVPPHSPPHDLLALYLKHEEEMQGDGGATAAARDKQAEDFVTSFLFAGRDSTASALSWLFYELGLPENRDILKAIQSEVDATLSGESPAFDDLQHLPHLRGALWETLRLHPPVFLIMLCSKADDTLPDGVVVPAGTRLSISTYAMGRSRGLYGEDVLRFRPSRWIPFKQPSPYDFPMFKGGRRTCLGKDMALTEAVTVAAVLLQNFTPEVVNHTAYTYGPKLSMSVFDKQAKRDQLMMRLVPRKRATEPQTG